MPNLFQSALRSDQLFQKKNVVLWAIALSSISLFLYLFFSGPMQGVERPIWYQITTFVIEDIALIIAGILCCRNGFSKQMPSSSQAWLLIGISLFSFLIGNLFFGLCELLWHSDPAGSLSDLFFVISYISLALGVITTIISKQVKLKIYQWSIVAGITTYAAVIAIWIMTPPSISANSIAPSAVVTTAKSTTSAALPTAKPIAVSTSEVPTWVQSINDVFKPHSEKFNQFYVWCDVVLFGLAVAIILAFWGGRLSNAWQVNAQAIICFYIADMWFAYATNHISNYQSGFVLEVFWVFGAIQFGVAATLEFEHMTARQKFVDSDQHNNRY